MLLTVCYMIATVMQARKISFLKTHLYDIFKGNKSRSSLMLYTKMSPHINGDCNGHEQDENFMSSYFCLNKGLAKLGELLWYQGNLKLCTIYPQQQIDVSEWLIYPYGDSSFPLYTNNCCQISSEPDVKMHILVEADLATYKSQALTIATKLEDYGLITSWIANRNIGFILETDVDHITNFIIAVMQGQYYINNNLLLTRIQSVFISGKPCVYESKQFNQPDKNVLYALTDAARIASQQKKPVEVAKLSGVSVHPQNKDLNTQISVDSARTNDNNDITASVSTPATPPSTPVVTDITKHVSLVTPFNVNTTLSKKVPTATSAREKSEKPEILAKAQFPIESAEKKWEGMEREDNTLSDSNNKVSSQTSCSSTSTEGTVMFKDALSLSQSEKDIECSKMMKTPNVVIYADSLNAISNIKTVLQEALDPNRYIIYALSREEARSNVWIDQVVLVVICGNLDAEISAQLVEYIIQGGKLLALCSDMLHTLLPSFKTAEVRESELVRVSYGKWKRVRMMHHVFCYHASPVRNRFSQDHEDPRTSLLPALNPPSSTKVKDKRGKLHSFEVKVLGTEETWHNPSILLATLASSGGKVVFSQIHLEVDPTQYEHEEDKFKALKESNSARLEIIRDLLSTHLGMEINHASKTAVLYTQAYFLGKYEMKVQMLEKLKDKIQEKDVIKLSKLDIQFYSSNEKTKSPSASFLPVMMHMCPANFSTVKYFEALTTKNLGRLVIYTDVITSSMHVTESKLEHGLAVIPQQQTHGQGRGSNVWLSPMGCAMFTLQIHIPTFSILGGHISLLQHIASVAFVSAVRSKPGYEDIDLRLKWPNDIYIGNRTKIGGVIIPAQVEGQLCICNIGAGINLSNSEPTTCINDMIRQYNQKHGTKLETFWYEQYLACVFNELEILLDIVQNGNMKHFYELYYRYWLHSNAHVMVVKPSGKSENVSILGIDDFGYLLVKGTNNTFSVHPDGNSFDLIKGLIVPK